MSLPALLPTNGWLSQNKTPSRSSGLCEGRMRIRQLQAYIFWWRIQGQLANDGVTIVTGYDRASWIGIGEGAFRPVYSHHSIPTSFRVLLTIPPATRLTG